MPATVASSTSQAGRDTSSSNGKVFAKASKEWTIPPRPRPGRKAAEPAAAAPKAAKGAQNRDAQRAFRERKQDYVAELEAKIKEYENQEIQKAITLQNISIALKNENATLRTDNDRLRALVLQLGGDPNPSPDGNCSDASGSTNTSRRTRKKRPRDPATTAAGPSAGFPQGDSRSGSTEPSGRQMVGVVSAGAMPISVASNAASPSAMLGSSYGSTPASPGYRSVQELLNQPGPSSAAGTPIGSPSTAMGGFVTHGPLSPPVWTPYQTPYQIQPPPFAYQRTSPSVLSGPGFDVASLPSAASLKASSTRTTADDVDVDCGFCTENDTCVCRMIKEDASLGGRNGSASGSTLREAIALDTKPIVPVGQVSGIDRPQPATGAAPMETVALLRRRPKKTGSQSIWAVVPAPALPECTGDPSNCPACADDPFGKAFCEELGTEPPAEAEVVQHQEQQIKREQEDVTMTVSCCGAPEACGSDAHACSTDGTVADGHKHLTLGVDGSVAQGDGKMIPVADAWRQFKSHPNASFADLSLLAEVVSGRLPVPASPSATHPASPTPSASSHDATMHAAAPDLNASALVPPPAKRRRLELDAAHVQEALRMLDARSASGAGGEGVRETAVRRSHLTRRLSDLRGSLEGLQEQQQVDGTDGDVAGLGLAGL